MTQPARDDPPQVVEADWTWTGDAFESVRIAVGNDGLIAEVGLLAVLEALCDVLDVKPGELLVRDSDKKARRRQP